MKVTKKAIALLQTSFARSGKVDCSGIDTDSGSFPLWGQLARAVLGDLVRAGNASDDEKEAYDELNDALKD